MKVKNAINLLAKLDHFIIHDPLLILTNIRHCLACHQSKSRHRLCSFIHLGQRSLEHIIIVHDALAIVRYHSIWKFGPLSFLQRAANYIQPYEIIQKNFKILRRILSSVSTISRLRHGAFLLNSEFPERKQEKDLRKPYFDKADLR